MVGLLGGSFDPIHHGHLIVARAVLESLGLESLRFVPAREQPFKRGAHGATPEQRAAMVAAAIRKEPRFALERSEVDRAGPSYTVDTLRTLRAREPDVDFVLLVGADAAAELNAWREAAEIPRLARVVAFARAGAAPEAGPMIWRTVGSRRSTSPLPRCGRGFGPAGRFAGWCRTGRPLHRSGAAILERGMMIKRMMTAVFGTRFAREYKRLQPLVDQIKAHEERLGSFTEVELKAQTQRFKDRIAEQTGATKAELEAIREAKHGCADPVERERLEAQFHQLDQKWKKELAAVLDELLPEAYATVREACRRMVGTTVMVTGHELIWDMVPYDVQLIGGIVLHQGRIAEMATGEGKTLVATLPLYLNALTGRGTHLVTVNNYLARRDSQWMGHVFTYLGLSVACLDDTEPSSPERRAAYLADITYGTNNEFGFDYLRDNMVFSLEQRVQREHAYAIIDEVDSILIDEARTPLIISGPVGNEEDDKYAQFNRQVAELVRKQTGVVNTLLAEAEKLLEGDSKARDEAALKLYQAQLGMPKSKRLLKILNETGVKQMVQKMELEAIADRKLPMRQQRMREVEETLYFVLDERGHSVHLTDQGATAMSPGDPTCSWSRTSRRRSTRSRRTPSCHPTTASRAAGKSRGSTPSRARSFTSSTSCSRPTRCTRRKWTISCRRVRC